MTFHKRNGLLIVNIVIPLVCGLYIYLTKVESTYISDFFSTIRSVLPSVSYPYMIRYHACDFLWAYSLFFCLRLSMGDALKGKHNLTVVVVTSVVAIILESIQLIKGIPGTFDWLDIFIELIAAIVALIITTIIERRFNHYEEKHFS